MNYRYLPHTADAKMQAWGKTIEEAFENAALAMFGLLILPEKVRPLQRKEFTVEAKSKEALLYDYLDHCIYLLSVDGFLLAKTEKLIITQRNRSLQLSTVIWGDYWKRYEVSGDIKAATYNDMFISEQQGKVLVQFVVDI